MPKCLSLALVVLLILHTTCVFADDHDHYYSRGDVVVVYASKIGPINNPLETYDFFKEPGCPPASLTMKPPTLGQALAGEELYPMKMDIRFGQDQSYSRMCAMNASSDDLARWSYMVLNHYSYKLTVDGLPVWAPFGTIAGVVPHIYTQRSIYFGVNGNRIVNVSLKVGGAQPIKADAEYTFTYSVRFMTSKAKFEERYAIYVDHKVLRPQVRWVSLVNSVLIVIFLVTVVLLIVSRTLKADLAKIDEERRLRFEGHDSYDDSGWKQLYADVFRVPKRPALLAALLGSGKQLYVLVLLTIFAAALDSKNPVVGENSGGVAIVLYAITSFVGGFASSSEFARFSLLSPRLARYWIRCLCLTQILLPGLFFCSTLLNNTLATAYGSAQAIHVGSLTILVALWLVVSCPLSLVGTFLGRYVNRRSKRCKDVPHINQIPRLVPKPRNWFARPALLIIASGILPFVSIFMEVYLVVSSFWFDKSYQMYGFLTLALFIYTIVTVCVSVAATFVLLSTENHKWPWMSFAFGSSCAFYVFLYTVYFFMFKTKMTGLFMTVFYFSYSAFFCVVLACVGGSLAYSAASTFVAKIYRQAKND